MYVDTIVGSWTAASFGSGINQSFSLMYGGTLPPVSTLGKGSRHRLRHVLGSACNRSYLTLSLMEVEGGSWAMDAWQIPFALNDDGSFSRPFACHVSRSLPIERELAVRDLG